MEFFLHPWIDEKALVLVSSHKAHLDCVCNVSFTNSFSQPSVELFPLSVFKKIQKRKEKEKTQLNLIIYHQLVSTKLLTGTEENFEIQGFFKNKSKSWLCFIICHCMVHKFTNHNYDFFTSRRFSSIFLIINFINNFNIRSSFWDSDHVKFTFPQSAFYLLEAILLFYYFF